MHSLVLICADGWHSFGFSSFSTVAPTIDNWLSHIGSAQSVSSRGLDQSGHSDIDALSNWGELIFTTSMSGYQETFTDPSYLGQIVCMTYPLIGNYGISARWDQTTVARHSIPIRAAVVSSLYHGPVEKGMISISEWAKRRNITIMEGIDTRSLTRHIRDKGLQHAAIIRCTPEELDTHSLRTITATLQKQGSMLGTNMLSRLPSTVKTSRCIKNQEALYDARLVLLEYGCKRSIIEQLSALVSELWIFSSSASIKQIEACNPHFVLVSNGPGDPQPLTPQVELLSMLKGTIPLCGICLGHQLLALSLGARTYQMKFGHHGSNHPVKDLNDNKLYITSQNHGFAIEYESLPKSATPWFVNTNDGSLEGFLDYENRIFSVQFHPEAHPGPRDTSWIFERFCELCKVSKQSTHPMRVANARHAKVE